MKKTSDYIMDEFSMLGPIDIDSIAKNANRFKKVIKETDIETLIKEGKSFKEINEICKESSKIKDDIPFIIGEIPSSEEYCKTILQSLKKLDAGYPIRPSVHACEESIKEIQELLEKYDINKP